MVSGLDAAGVGRTVVAEPGAELADDDDDDVDTVDGVAGTEKAEAGDAAEVAPRVVDVEVHPANNASALRASAIRRIAPPLHIVVLNRPTGRPAGVVRPAS